MNSITEMLTPKFQTKEEVFETLEGAERMAVKAVEEMVDSYPCGGAYLLLAGNHMLIKAFKKFGEKDHNGDYRIKTKTGDWCASKYYAGGYSIWVHGEGRRFQNMDANYKKYQTIIEALGLSGISVYSYID